MAFLILLLIVPASMVVYVFFKDPMAYTLLADHVNGFFDVGRAGMVDIGGAVRNAGRAMWNYRNFGKG